LSDHIHTVPPLELDVPSPLRKDERANRKFFATRSLPDDHHDGLTTPVPLICVDAMHLSQVIAAGFHDARGV